jgi:predicted membrane protein
MMVRVFSLILASVFSVIIFVNPHVVAESQATLQHSILSVQLLAICSAFVHGIGFSAQRWYFKILLSPWVHWPVMFSLLVI